ncbi:MAG: cell division protein ZapA [Epulopiscium sp.]|nr:cell division protein ZapA [Candidatus Epulonipiscium sp.]
MTPKNKIEVLIGGKIYTLVGKETQEYMQNLALYINKKMDQISNSEMSKRLDTNMISILTSLNVADELFKQIEVCEQLKQEIQEKEKEVQLYQDEMGELQQENIELKEVLQNAQLEALQYKLELQEYIETFEEKKEKEG